MLDEIDGLVLFTMLVAGILLLYLVLLGGRK